MAKVDGCVGKVTTTSQFDSGSGPNPNPAYQWDTKRKLFSLAEVCTLPSETLSPSNKLINGPNAIPSPLARVMMAFCGNLYSWRWRK